MRKKPTQKKYLFLLSFSVCLFLAIFSKPVFSNDPISPLSPHTINLGNGNLPIRPNGLNSLPPGITRRLLENGVTSQVGLIQNVQSVNKAINGVSSLTKASFGNSQGFNVKTNGQNIGLSTKNNFNAKDLYKITGVNNNFVSLTPGLIYAYSDEQGQDSLVKQDYNSISTQLTLSGEGRPLFSSGISQQAEEDFKFLSNELRTGLLDKETQNPIFSFKQKAHSYQNWNEQCFDRNAPITMADGSVKVIYKITKDDSVLSFNEAKKTFEAKKVTAIFTKEATEIVQIGLSNGQTVKVTSEHPFWSEGKWIAAANLKPGSKLLGEQNKEVIVKKLQKLHKAQAVFNFEVKDNHSYLAYGVVVHNRCVLRAGQMVNLPDNTAVNRSDVILPSIAELEYPVVQYLKSHPKQGQLIGEHPEIASNVVAGVIGLTQETMKLDNQKTKFESLPAGKQKDVIIELVLLTLKFGPSATTNLLEQTHDPKLQAIDGHLKNYVKQNPVLTQWIVLNNEVQ
jgi:hypothetical protein